MIALLASLERDDLQTLREYEAENANRGRVISAIDSVISRPKRSFFLQFGVFMLRKGAVNRLGTPKRSLH